MKKVLKIIGIIILILISAAIVTPFLFHDKILVIAKKEINKRINADANFKDVDISFFRQFPKVSVKLTDLSIVGIDDFKNDTLLASKGLDITIHILSLLKGKKLDIYGFDLESPRINALINKEGKTNWDILNASDNMNIDTSSYFTINVQRYAIHNGYFTFRDLESDINMEILNLDHSGKGDISKDIFTLATKSSASSLSIVYANVPWLYKVNTIVNSDIIIDNWSSKYEFNNADITINKLGLNSSGYFQFLNDSSYGMDISFKAPSSDFKEILSLVPGIYKEGFDELKTSGNTSFSGFVKGIYNNVTLPAYKLDLQVNNGFLQYPGLPKAVKNILLDVKLENPDGKPDNGIVSISKGHIEMDNEPFDFNLIYKNPETTKYLDAKVKGKLNLNHLSSIIKLSHGTTLSGILDADAFVKGNLKSIQNQLGNFMAGGFFNVQHLNYSSKDFPQPIKNGTINAQIVNAGGIADNTTIDITSGYIEVGNDPIDFTLKIKQPMTAINFDGTARGSFTLDNLKQFMTLEQGNSVSGKLNGNMAFKGSKDFIDKKEYNKIHLNGKLDLENVKYISSDYPTGILISKASVQLDQANTSISQLEANYLNTNFTADGILNNLIGYAISDQTLIGIINAQADYMNLNEWIGSEADSTSVAGDPFLVPANLNITIHAKAGLVKYDKVDYTNIIGSLILNKESILLQNLKTNALDGNIDFNGTYSTQTNKKQPDINLTYEVKNVNIQKAFFAFNTIQKIMPIGQFLAGKISSALTINGNLHGNMMPDLSSLTGNGNFFLIEGVLNKFKPLEKIASSLNIKELEKLSVRDIKNYIDFKNGKVFVKPFIVQVNDIVLEIGGMHGFDQTMDYVVQMKVPRKYLGTEGNSLVNNLVAQANNNGIPITLGETVDLKINLTGKISDPIMRTELKEVTGDAMKELKQQAEDYVKQKVDSTRQTIKDSASSIKKQITDDLKDELKKQIFNQKDSTKYDSLSAKPLDNVKQKAEQTIKNTLNNLLKKQTKPVKDTVNNN